MRKMAVTAFLILIITGFATAQIPTSGNIFFGYSYYNSSVSSFNRTNMNGWEASVEGKLVPFIGIVADVDEHYGSQLFGAACPVLIPNCSLAVTDNFTEHNYLFGPRASVSVGKFRPFAELLVGAGHVHVNGGSSDTSFASSVGGGIDYKLLRVLAWRFQGDYIHTNLFNVAQNNVRLSTGIVFRF